MSVPTDKAPRRRLVIALDRGKRVSYRPGPAAPRKSRAAKALAILGIGALVVFLCVTAGAFFWWRHYKTTPAYSLALLVDAAQRNDMDTVDKIVDTDKIVDNFAAKVTEKTVGRYGAALSNSMRKQIESLVPTLLPAIRQSVRDGIAERVKEISENAKQKPFIIVAMALPYFVNIAENGDTAEATVIIHDSRVEGEMQRDGQAWKLVAVQDDALLQRIVDQVIKDLPAIGQGD
ncbi:MAG TPA: hypothetical protein VE821_08610, partial [Pyrinomonadaceae bacterium]|nr:hypothetical protein [Pyrinomonadaceae bacterium]